MDAISGLLATTDPDCVTSCEQIEGPGSLEGPRKLDRSLGEVLLAILSHVIWQGALLELV